MNLVKSLVEELNKNPNIPKPGRVVRKYLEYSFIDKSVHSTQKIAIYIEISNVNDKLKVQFLKRDIDYSISLITSFDPSKTSKLHNDWVNINYIFLFNEHLDNPKFKNFFDWLFNQHEQIINSNNNNKNSNNNMTTISPVEIIINALVGYDAEINAKYATLEGKLTHQEYLLSQAIEQIVLLNEKINSPTVTKTGKAKPMVVDIVKLNPQTEIISIVNKYSDYTGIEQKQIYNTLYQAYYEKYDEDIKVMAADFRPKVSILTYATRHDLIEKLYFLAINLFTIK